MSGGSTSEEFQRSLGYDDVATIRYALAGLDELSGTSDDFSYSLLYVGMTEDADIVLDFDSAQITSPNALGITRIISQEFSDHFRLVEAEIFFREETSWFFNTTLDNATVFANFAHEGIEDGTEDFPFNSVAEALAEVADGGTIVFSPGISAETPIIDQNVTLMASGGTASIGFVGGRNARETNVSKSKAATGETSSTRKTGFVANPR